MTIKALTFDVFGTTVDWCSGIAREAEAALAPKGCDLDWIAFANSWRKEYNPAMEAVRTGGRPYETMDTLHREMLEGPLAEYDAPALTDQEKLDLSLAWRRLPAWPDAPAGLDRLREKFIVAALSNGNMALTLNLSKFAGIRWDIILGAELVQTYKPLPAVYDSASKYLDLDPSEIMMVACHVWDLDAAHTRGMKTAFVARPDEYGPGQSGPQPEPGTYDYQARDLTDLAEQLGC